MKKNVLKILLALVMVAMVFALVACGGGDETKSTPKKGTETPAEETKVNAVEELTNSLNAVVGGVAPYMTNLSSIKADSEVGLDIGVGGYYGAAQSAGNFKLTVQGNAKATNPELKVAFSLDKSKDGAGKDYLAIGYKDGYLYLTEPLSLINAEKDSNGRSRGQPNSIKMDATMLKAGVNNVAGFGMGKLAGVVGGLADIKLDTIVSEFLSTNQTLVGSIAKLIQSDTTSNNKEIALVISSANVKQLLGIAENFLGDTWTSITGTVDSVLSTGYDSFGLYVNGNTIGIDKEKAKESGAAALKFSDITGNFMPAIKIIGVFDKENTAADKALNGVKVEFNMESINLAVGLAIDLRTLATGKNVSLSFSGYSPKNLTSSIDVSLGQKDRYATLTATANTATAFKNADTNIATASLILGNGTTKANATASALYDGESIYLDLSEIGNIAGNYFDMTSDVKFVQTFHYGKNAADFGKEQGDNFNVKEALAYMLENVGKTTSNKPAEDKVEMEEVADDAKLKTEGIWTTVYNIVLDIKEGYFGKYDYRGADGFLYKGNEETGKYEKVEIDGVQVKPAYLKKDAKQEDVTKLLSEIEWVDKFVNVELTKNGKGLTFEQIGSSLKGKFNEVKAIFTGADSAASAQGNKAKVALFGNNGKNLIAVVTKFVNLPTVGEGDKFVYTRAYKVVEDKDGVKSAKEDKTFTVGAVSITTPEDARKYLNAIFALDDGDLGATDNVVTVDGVEYTIPGSYNDWPQEMKTIFGIDSTYGFQVAIIETVLGISVESFCSDGIFLYASYDEEEGLSGQIGVENAQEQSYLEIGGSIKFVDAGNTDLTNNAKSDTQATIAYKGEDEKYHMNEQIWDAIVAALHDTFDEVAA